MKDAVLLNAFLVAYWLAKEMANEMANRKFPSLINLFKIVSPESMKYFNYSGEETVQSIFLTIGTVLMKKVLDMLRRQDVVAY